MIETPGTASDHGRKILERIVHYGNGGSMTTESICEHVFETEDEGSLFCSSKKIGMLNSNLHY